MAGKRFTFSLETVLRVRKHETERARQALLEAAVEREQHETLLADAHQRLQNLADSPTTGGTIGTLVFRQYDAFRRDAQRAFDMARQTLQYKQQLEEEARVDLLDRRRAEEALKNLREQQKAEHQRQEEAHDIAFLDEQAITGFTRKKS
ncbi:MAG TPA: flagellar export protein FliJ [Rhodothermales bacterium]|nr:flagellar export protein FliJ [Rhodothermales bacterium]